MAGGPPTGRARSAPNVTLAALALVSLAYSLMQTMVVPALPVLQADLGSTPTWTAWIFTGFLLTSAVATPLFAKLGDQYGKERLLVVSIAVFLAGCIGAVFAWDIASMIAFRAIQGAGGAVFPLSFAIIADELPRERVGIGIGLVSATLGIGGGLGIVLSGVIVDHLSWRWLFVLGAAVTALALVLVHRYVPESPHKRASRIDVTGAALLSGMLVTLLLGLTEGERWGWGSPAIAGLFAASALLLAAWVRAELRTREPLVDMRMMARRPVLFTNATAFIAGFAMFGSFILVPGFVEAPGALPADLARLVDYGFGASTVVAGLYILPSSAAMLIGGPLAGLLGRRIGVATVLAAGMALLGAGAAGLALLHDRGWEIALAMLVLGTGIAFAFASMPKLITDAVDRSETGIATGMNTVMRTVGGVVGGQVGATVLTTLTIRGTHVPSESAYTAAFGVGAIAAFLAVPVALLAVRGRARGRELGVLEATAEVDGAG